MCVVVPAAMTPAVLLRRPVSELPADVQSVIGSAPSNVLFAPLLRLKLSAAVLPAVLLGAPAAAVFLACVWLASSQPLHLAALLGVVVVAVAGFWVAAAQVLRVWVAVQAIGEERVRLQGDEGLYRAPGWLLLVRGAEAVSLLPRQRVRQLVAVRVRYLRGSGSFCVTYPCAILDDGREVLLRTPPLATDATVGELLDGWGVPVLPSRLDVTDRQLGRFQLL